VIVVIVLKKVAEKLLERGIDTLVDLDLTEKIS
jgi:hypothetical protein